MSDLETLTIGMVWDMLEERRKDTNGFVRDATQADFDRYAKG